MFRRLGLALAAVLVLAPAAFAAAPSFIAQQGGSGVATPDGSLRFIAKEAPGKATTIQAFRGGTMVASKTIDGAFGVPVLPNGSGGTYADGIFRDGSAFLLQSVGFGASTEFRIVSSDDLSVRDSFALKGIFSYDALSPDGRTLYLTQHTSAEDVAHYVVRAYDLRAHALRTGRIADKTQRGWVMQGFPATRVTSATGRWVYTMYANPNGYPFVHALDTVAGKAHCVGFASPGDGAVFNGRLALKGPKLQVRLPDGSVWRVIDLKSWRVTKR